MKMITRIPDSKTLSWTLGSDSAEISSDSTLSMVKYLKSLEFLDKFSLVIMNIAEEFPNREFTILIMGDMLKVRIAQPGDVVSIIVSLDLTGDEEELMYSIVTSVIDADYSGNGIFTLVSDRIPYTLHITITDMWKMSIGPLTLVNPDLALIPDAIADTKKLIASGVRTY